MEEAVVTSAVPVPCYLQNNVQKGVESLGGAAALAGLVLVSAFPKGL